MTAIEESISVDTCHKEPGIYVSPVRLEQAKRAFSGFPIFCDDRLFGDAWYAVTSERLTQAQYDELRRMMADSNALQSASNFLCVICNGAFKAKRADATICSAACRMRKRRAVGKK